MDYIAELIARIIVKKEHPEKVREDIVEFRKHFTELGYCFETVKDAYKYINLRDFFNCL